MEDLARGSIGREELVVVADKSLELRLGCSTREVLGYSLNHAYEVGGMCLN